MRGWDLLRTGLPQKEGWLDGTASELLPRAWQARMLWPPVTGSLLGQHWADSQGLQKNGIWGSDDHTETVLTAQI